MTSKDGPSSQDRKYGFAVSAGALLMARHIQRVEKSDERKKKMARVVKQKESLLKDAFSELAPEPLREKELIGAIKDSIKPEQELIFLIDMAFVDPFAPYRLKSGDHESALNKCARIVRLPASDVADVLDVRKDAARAHRDLKRLALIGGGAATLVLAGGAVFAAPLIVGWAAGAGLAGAAATAHGLATLGGGALAVGGYGMAGGMWLLGGSSLALAAGGAGLVGTGLLSDAGKSEPTAALAGQTDLLTQLGPKAARAELIKAQVTYKVALLPAGSGAEPIVKLREQRDEVIELAKRERSLNERNSPRVKELEELRDALEDAIGWMESAWEDYGAS